MYIDQTYSHVITDLVRNPKNEITGYKLEDGQIISKEEALYLSRQTGIKGISEEVYKQKDEFLKSLPNDDMNNLFNLPVEK